ncbi:MAG: chromosome partitioning protein ParA, partial [Bacteroidales bacterium]|nr:chromosome partitioning protein ParA [Bacteroidales bacterium]
MSTIQNNIEHNEDTLNVKDFIFMCLAKWYWFVISLFVVLSLATFYILRTQPTYTRSMQVMIKNDSKGKSMSDAMSEFSDMGMFKTSSSVDNELVAIQSPAIMAEVVNRLHLDMNYSVDGTFHKKTIYGKSLPVSVIFMDIEDNGSASATVEITKDGNVSLSDFAWSANGEILESEEIVNGKLSMGDGAVLAPIETPLGRVVVSPTQNYVPEDLKIFVRKSGKYAATQQYSKLLTTALNDKKSDIINLSITDVSTQRAVDVLNTVVAVYNEKWVEDKNKITVSTSKFIKERLDSLVNELGDVDKDISSFKSKQLLPDVASASSIYMTQSTKANEMVLELNNQLQMARYILEYVKNDANKGKLLPANSGIQASSIEKQISEYNELQLKRSKLVSGSDIKNPIVNDLDESLASMRTAIITSVENQIVTLKTQIKNTQAHERQTVERIAANPKQEEYLLSVGRQQKVKEALYLFLLQKREENELSQAFTAYNTRIITPPTGSLFPVAPAKSKIWLIAFVLGLAIPVGIIFIKENLITTVRGRRDLASCSMPLIGEIPMAMKPDASRWKFWEKKQNDKRLIVVQDGNRDVINEAFR